MGKYFKKKVKNKFDYKPILKVVGAIVGIIILIIFIVLIIKAINKKPKEKPTELVVKESLTLQLNDPVPKEKDLFDVYENVKDGMVEVNYLDLDMTKLGTYAVIVTIKTDKIDDNFVVNVTIDDNVAPILELRDVTINEGEKYSLTDFVVSCSDNSELCLTDYSDNRYLNIKEVGTHDISIEAKDKNGNSIVKSATLTIKKDENKKDDTKPDVVEPEPIKICEFGSTAQSMTFVYPFTLTVLDDNDNCPLDVNKYDLATNETKYTKFMNKMYSDDLRKLWEETKEYNTKDIYLQVHSVRNQEGTGIIGYSIHITLFIDEKDEIDIKDIRQDKYVKAEYYLKEDKTRYYVINKLT